MSDASPTVVVDCTAMFGIELYRLDTVQDRRNHRDMPTRFCRSEHNIFLARWKLDTLFNRDRFGGR